MSVRKIAEQIGRAASTVSRELSRNGRKSGYRPYGAHRKATSRRARDHRRCVEKTTELHQALGELLAQRWNPEQIARHLGAKHPDDRSMIPTRPGSAARTSTPTDYCAWRCMSQFAPGRYFPKATDLAVHSSGHLRAVEEGINKRPRRVLHDTALVDLLAALLASTDQCCCDVG